jgi:carbohydrate-binding DOMON domain-containing protein
MAVQIRTGQVAGLDEQIRDVMGTALVAGTNVTITVNDAGDTITIASTATSTTTGELLMQDGVTSPPVPLTNEAGDDWLYQG